MIKILNWNTEANTTTPQSRNGKFQRIQQKIKQYNPDVICLTEAYPETISTYGQTIISDLSDWHGGHEDKGARKVVLWSKCEWRDVDILGSDRLPEGRFISAVTTIQNIELCVIGMCIPYHDYRNNKKWGEKRKSRWQGACEYLDTLQDEILRDEKYSSKTVLLGDFNLQIPPKNYPHPSELVNQKREKTFLGWNMPTSGELHAPNLDKRFIDHIALTSDFELVSMQFISRFDEDSRALSDHNGVIIEVKLK